jgi:hypothetical protein
LPHGLGTLFSVKNKFKYEGDFLEGQRSGFGTETKNDGTVFVGKFKNDNWEGKGTAKYADGSLYKGQFLNGKQEG